MKPLNATALAVLICVLPLLSFGQQGSEPESGFSRKDMEEFNRLNDMGRSKSSIVSLVAKQEYEKAISDADEFARRYSAYPQRVSYVRYIQALALTKIERYDRAMKSLDEAVKINGSAVWAYLLRAKLHRLKKDFDKAVSDANKAIELGERIVKNPSMSSDLAKGSDPFKEMFFPEYRGSGYVERSLARLDQGRTSEALADVRKSFEFSVDEEAIGVLGKLLAPGEFLKELTSLIDRIKTTVEEPRDAVRLSEELIHRRALFYADAQNPEAAITDLTTLIDFGEDKIKRKGKMGLDTSGDESEMAVRYMLRGQIYGLVNKPDAALGDFNRVLSLRSSETGNALFNRGKVYIMMGRPADAIKDFSTLIEANTSRRLSSEAMANLYWMRAEAYARNNQLALAMADIETTISYGSFMLQAYYLRSQINCVLGRKTAASDDESKVASLGGRIEQPCR